MRLEVKDRIYDQLDYSEARKLEEVIIENDIKEIVNKLILNLTNEIENND